MMLGDNWCKLIYKDLCTVAKSHGHGRSRKIGTVLVTYSTVKMINFSYTEPRDHFWSKMNVTFEISANEYTKHDPSRVNVIQGYPRSSEITDLG